MTDKTGLVEDVLGDFGFRVVWAYSEYWCDFTAYQILAIGEPSEERLFARKDWQTLPTDTVADVAQAEVFASGFVKWDGCCEIEMPQQHFCSSNDVAQMGTLFLDIHRRAFELMGRPWDAPDKTEAA